jgi:hypothetical protein
MMDEAQLLRAMQISEIMIADEEFGINLVDEAMHSPDMNYGTTLGLRLLQYMMDHGMERKLAALCSAFYTVGISHYNDHVRKHG